MKKNGKFIVLFSVIFFLILILKTNNAYAINFDPNNIISDEEMFDSRSLSPADIQEFLEARGSFLATYVTKNFEGKIKKASDIFYEAANNYDCEDADLSDSPTIAEKEAKCVKVTINPKFLLVLVQKEQSLIDDPSPTANQLDWAVGYGCPDNQACNTRWKGFGKQVNSAALQFFDYLKNPQRYSFKAGITYRITNTNKPDMMVTPANNATAALYNYTPHVYNGNFNFFKLWLRYFTLSYPNSTLMQAKGEVGVWLLQNRTRRAFLSRGALTSRFDPNKIVQVSKTDLEKYTVGLPIKFPQYSVVRSPRGTVFLIVDDKKRGFTSSEAFRKIGFNPEEVINVSWDDINSFADGKPITATSSYLTGALLQDKKTGGVFFVTDGTKAPIWDKILLKTKFRGRSITPVSPEKLTSFATVEPAIFGDGELLKSSISPAVYVIDNGKKRSFTSGEIFEKLGYKWKNVIMVPKKILDLYPDTDPINESYLQSDENIDLSTSTTASLITSTSTNAVSTSTNSNISTSSTLKISTSTGSLQDEINSILNP
jgi:hypothetical protein